MDSKANITANQLQNEAFDQHFYLEALERQGFAILPGVLDKDALDVLRNALSQAPQDKLSLTQNGGVFAIRNLLNALPEILDLANNPSIRACVEPVLGPNARTIRGIFFDKTEQSNWKVPWHQDVTITVQEKRGTPGFQAWTVKAGIPHVQPPLEILENIVTLRIHLDDTDASNGALKVIPGSHKAGRLAPDEVREWVERVPAVTCCCTQGDILVMRPLLLHASGSGTLPQHRRILHLEFSADQLPDGLDWFGS
jgi:ectoine hydroxylase-related dioxygenase (phytanoyl-CoA dioxygenase family)